MRQILRGLVGLVLVGAVCAGLALCALRHLRSVRVRDFAASIVQENSPIAEIATRKVVWRVFLAESAPGKDTVSDTVYTLKAGYDLSRIRKIDVDAAARIVTIALPPPQILSIDHFLRRSVSERKSLVERVFGSNTDDGRLDRLGIARLAKDCDTFGLLSAKDLRETFVTTLARQLRLLGGYGLVVEDGLELPARAMFNAYFEEKGVSFRL